MLAVIAAHAGITALAGGYVGVDIFFVISGFLITQQLLRECDRSGRVSLLGFYARRARRILPAATLVVLAVMAVCVWSLGAVRTKSVITDGIWSAGFAANVHFARVGTDYFAQDLPPSPLQHYWSLSVEEQFYLAWPLVLIGVLWLWARARRRSAGNARPATPRLWLAVAVGGLSVASLVWSIHDTSASATTAYFSTFARSWELGVGALAAILVGLIRRSANRWLAQAATLAGSAMIVASCLAYDDATPFPGSAALLPVLGSALVVVGGALRAGPTVVGRLLSLRPLRAVGDWSYSLYLWHYPVLVIPQVRDGHVPSPFHRLLLVVLALLLAALTYRFVEQPLRRHRAWRVPWRAVLLYPLCLVLVIAGGGGASSVASGLHATHGAAITLPDDWRSQPGLGKKPRVALVRQSVKAAQKDHDVPASLSPSPATLTTDYPGLGGCDYATGTRQLCPRGDKDGTKTMVVYGNSHARHWIDAIEPIAKRAGYRTYYLVKSQCVPALVTPVIKDTQRPFTDCTDFHDWAVKQIAALHPDLLVISGQPTAGGIFDEKGDLQTSKAVEDRLEYEGDLKLLDKVMPSADRTVWIRDIPTIDQDPATCLSTHTTLKPCIGKPVSWDRTRQDNQVKAAKQAGADVVDMNNLFCYRGRCPMVVGSTVTYRDVGHMTTEYAEQLSRPLARRLALS